LFELSGSVIGGRYAVHEKLGEGGMGTVYAGARQGLHRKVAIKVLKPELAGDPLNVRRFLREARAASVIAHENIVEIIDFGQLERHPVYFVMEFLDGQDLKARLAQAGALPWRETLAIVLQVATALEAAHAHGIVHRDIKPGNIFIERRLRPEADPWVKVLDFGIAKVIEDGRGLTRGATTTAQGILGTVAYMAPEQARSGTLDGRTDIYQLGAVLYQMLVGQVPFAGSNPFVVLDRHVNEAPKPLRAWRSDIPQELESIVLTCLAKRPDERFQSMTALLQALRQLDADAEAPIPAPSLPLRRTVVADEHGPADPAADTFALSSANLASTAPARVAAPRQRRGVWTIVPIALTLLLAATAAVELTKAPSGLRLERIPAPSERAWPRARPATANLKLPWKAWSAPVELAGSKPVLEPPAAEPVVQNLAAAEPSPARPVRKRLRPAPSPLSAASQDTTPPASDERPSETPRRSPGVHPDLKTPYARRSD